MGQVPSQGRIVTHVTTEGVIKSAIITHVGDPSNENSWVNLRIFEDAPGDLPHATSVPKNQNETGAPQADYSWDWPARV
jgi:hypothetical protein